MRVTLALIALIGCSSKDDVKPPVVAPEKPRTPEQLPPEFPQPTKKDPALPNMDPDYPTPAAAGTDKIFTTEDPDRGPKVPVDFALPAPAELSWSDHAYCEDDKVGIVCTEEPAPKGEIWRWRLATRKDKGGLLVAESYRGTMLVETYAYVLKGNGLADHRVHIDTHGRVIDALLFSGDRFSGRKVNGGNALSGCGGMSFGVKDQHVETLGCLQWSGDPMRDLERTGKYSYKRDAKGFIVDMYRQDSAGKSISKNDGVPHTTYKRDALERIVGEYYFDEHEQEMQAKNGCYGTLTERDATGTIVKSTCVATDGKPVKRIAGTSIETWEHDKFGCYFKMRHLAPDGTKALDLDRVHAENYSTNEYCENTVKECVDASDLLIPCGPEEPARFTYARDRFGQITSAKHYDNQKQPSKDPVYEAFELRKEWDSVGNKISESCFGTDKKLEPCGRTGFAGDRSTFDDAGRRIEVRFIDTDGKPGTNLGATTRKIKYDNYDHVFETTQLDEKGEPFVMMGQTMRRDLYDILHRHFAVLLLDGNGKPTRYAGCYQGVACPHGPWHAVRIVRRADGTPETNIYFDETGKEFQKFDCRTARCFDE